MREDPTMTDDFIKSDQWESENLQIFEKTKDADFDFGRGPQMRSNSFSGNERNRLFMQADGNYDDLSLVSGVDFLEDGRTIALLDYDGDGWMDMGVCSTASPRFRLMRNQLGDRLPENSAPRYIRVELIGGNETAEPQQEWSSRSGIGAKLMVHRGDTVQMFEHSCGEGLAGQNSAKIHIGFGDTPIDRIQVTWPSGKQSNVTEFEAGKLVTIRERDVVEN